MAFQGINNVKTPIVMRSPSKASHGRPPLYNDIDAEDASLAVSSGGNKVMDKFNARTVSEASNFLLPEDQLSLDMIQRSTDEEIKEYIFQNQPLYLSTCYDEFSRNFHTANVAKNSLPSVSLIKFGTPQPSGDDRDYDFDSSVLVPYYPVLSDWFSTFRKVPDDTAHLLSGKVITDTNLLIRLVRCHIKQKFFEPIFGVACIYTIIDDEIYRVTESFHFDATPENIRSSYGMVYNDIERDNPIRATNRKGDYSGCNVNIGDCSGAQQHLHMFNAVVPEELNFRDLFLVVQLSKILTSDQDKALQPYLQRNPPPEIAKHAEACVRLSKFQQPLGIGIVKISDESNKIGMLPNGKTNFEVTFQFYCQKNSLSDAGIFAAIRELYPTEGQAYVRMDPMEIEMKVQIIDLGQEHQMIDHLMNSVKAYTHRRSSSSGSNLTSSSGVTANISGRSADYGGSRSGSMDGSMYPITPVIIPSQFHSNNAELQYVVDFSTMEPYDRVTSSLAVKKLTTLLPLASMTSSANLTAPPGTSGISTVAALTSKGTSSAEFGGLTRQVKASVENTLYVYPLLCDKFSSKFRNLCLKFQVVEFRKDQPKSLMTTGAYDVLPAIYNTNSIVGPPFNTAAYTKVSYHLKCPVFSEEIKIRLPDIVTNKHWLKITVLHIHVKPNSQRGSLLNSMMRSSVDTKQIADRAFTDVGVGFLPLMNNGESLIEDLDHSVKIYGTTDGESIGAGNHGHASVPVSGADKTSQVTSSTSVMEGMVGIRTRAITSLVSTDRRVQVALKYQPVPLGMLPSSIMSPQVATLIKDRAAAAPPKEMKLLQVTTDLSKASALELSRHFFVLMRQLVRTMLGGCGTYSDKLSNPYKHTQTRCQAFLTLLQIIGKIANDATAPSASSEMSLEKQFLHAYVEYMFDEEVPIELDEQEKTIVRERSKKFLFDDEGKPKSYAALSNNNSNVNMTDNSGGDSFKNSQTDASRPISPSDVELQTDECFGDEDEEKSDKEKSRSNSPRSTRNSSIVNDDARSDDYQSISQKEKDDVLQSEKENAYKIATEAAAIVNGEETPGAKGRHYSSDKAPPVSEDDKMVVDQMPTEVLPMQKIDSIHELTKISTSAAVSHGESTGELPDMSKESGRKGKHLHNIDVSPPSKSPVPASTPVSATATPSDTLEKLTRNLASPGGGEKTPEEISAMVSSVERRSWGKFITDSLFVASALPEIGIAGLSKDSSSEVSDAISSRYLDDIAAHIVLQMEKVVIERQINHAVYAMSSELQFNSIHHADNPLKVTADIVLAGTRYRISQNSSAGCQSELNPFKEERAWYSAIDNGKDDDDADVYVVNSESIVSKLNNEHGSVRESRAASSQSSRRDSRSGDAVAGESDGAGPSATSNKVNPGNSSPSPELNKLLLNAVVSAAAESSYNAKDVGRGQVTIEPILPMYDTIEGYRNRMNRIKDPKKHDIDVQPSFLHWWPWLYEVLVFQWGAVLTITLSTIHLISSNNTQSMIGEYPYDADLRQQCSNKGSPKPDSIRSLLTEHCPFLLKMIFKSLVMRIKRENKRPPVQLDGQFLSALENLVMLLAVESATFCCGLWRSRKMVASLAAFLRSLFAVACPSQVIRLIRSFFRASRRNKRVEEAELRLQMVEEIGLFDHFVAANFPYTLDSPISAFTFRLVSPTPPASSLYAITGYTSAGIRGSTNPTPYLLAHTLINEVILSFRQDERKVKDAALEVMRDLLVRHSYDARYQSLVAQQRVVCMYLPLLRELLKDKDRIAMLSYESSQRKEMLVMIMYILHCMPDRLLREYIREICKVAKTPSNRTSGEEVPPANDNSPNGQRGKRSSFGSVRSSPRIVSLKTDKTLTNPMNNSFIPTTVHRHVEVFNLLMLMHCILDTFECPRIESAESSVQPAKSRSSTAVGVTSPSSGSTPTHATPGSGGSIANKDHISDVLASGVHLEGTAEAMKLTGLNLVRRHSSTDPNAGTSVPLATPGKAGNATALVNKLDQRLMNKKAASGAQARRSSAGAKGEERQWVVNARRMATAHGGAATEVGNEKYVLSTALNKSQQCAAAQQLCCSATRTVIQLLLVMFEECPPLLNEQDKSQSSSSTDEKVGEAATNAEVDAVRDEQEVEFILRDSNIDEFMVVGIKNLRVVYFMRLASTVILHALYCNQEDAVVMKLFRTASIIIRNFGAKVFLVAVEDSLQDWMRVSIYHCASQNEAVSDTASNFVLYVLRACFHYLGSATLVSNTVLAVINDVIEAILDNNQPLITTHSDEDKILSSLNNAVLKMKAAALSRLTCDSSKESSANVAMPRLGPSCTAAFCKSVITLMNNLEVIFQANADLRRHVSHPVGYDFLGANMLDGPWDERIASLIHNQRFKRRKVERDPSENGGKQAPISGFQLEEVMMHFVQAAEVYDPYKLPRFHMCWLENLARLHKLNGNKAESAEIRWRIYQLCQSVEDSWMQQWVPRPPLAWTRRGVEDPFASSGNAGFVSRGSLGGDSNGSGNTTFLSGGVAVVGQLKANGSIELSGRNFYALLLAALDGRPYRCWSNYQQYLTHMETALTVSTEEFCSTNLVHLAERSAFRKVHLYRLLRKPELMLKEYDAFVKQMRSIVSSGITSSMAIGTFYRVLYEGLGSPQHLRGKEFICRNANHVRVAEFESLLMSHLKSIVKEGVDIVIVADIRSAKELQNPNKAYIIMNSVKLIMNKVAKLNVRAMNNAAALGMSGYRTMNAVGKDASAFQKKDENGTGEQMESLNQVIRFKYSVPFTLTGKSQAKTIDQQWKRSTVLTVKEPFPYIMTRQLVFQREIHTYCPIEVAITDIEEKIEDMETELEKQNNSDTNNLMRIIQGCVLPQVNAGVGEVARVFLSPNRVLSDNVKELLQREKSRRWEGDKEELDKTPSEAAAAATIGDAVAVNKKSGAVIIGNADIDAADAQEIIAQQKKSKELVLRLKITLIDFLSCAKLLLIKARQVLLVSHDDPSSATSPSGGAGVAGGTGQKNSVTAGNGPIGAATTPGASSVDPHQEHLRIWQEEMEKGYENLKLSIMTYLDDLKDSDLLMALQ